MNEFKKFRKEIDSNPVSIYVLNEPLENRFPMHRHDKSQILLVEGGIAYLNTHDKQYYIPARHYVWIPPGVDHNIKFNSSSLVIHNIYFMDEDDARHPFYGRLSIYPVTGLVNEILQYSASWRGNILPGNWRYELLTTLKHILPHTSRQPFSILLPTTDDSRIQDILRYLHENVSEPLMLPDVAVRFGYSVRNLTRLFKQTLNTSFLQYVKMLKMIRAMELLLQTEMNVSEVAYEVGYSGITAFSNTFQQMINMRPSDFRLLK
ncbi:AraC family transcriptional regulator [Chitinophaga qingshengii]|uniref:Helix-turn-helix transcriptional regulator n=1 Tax=Chitinophaga qingshengii TaxID=1569794 RepID=A0ABR7TT14_9BACT|nr:AraC family transcriptional regulator [Chitinophaga qingshengii]MBC9933180.1 helix-turn-helix transcriptional regulator [Chitinophaga qingshengii]